MSIKKVKSQIAAILILFFVLIATQLYKFDSI